ncbi:extracellular solute-binding protein [Alkalicoccobacillus gibsonii]|uniref:extracellular solute-binding protein n=1 Tax=Alkalicoccobacillus gibsonii TaxID=79881 RepID=UPI003F7C8B84
MKIRLTLLGLVIILFAFGIYLVGFPGTSEKSSTRTSTLEPVDGDWSGTLKVALVGEFQLQDTTDPITGEKSEGLYVIKDEFERLYPGATVEFFIMPWRNYVANTQAMMAGNEADVYQMPGVNDFAAQGLLEPLQPFIDQDDYSLDHFSENLVDGWKTIGPDDDDPVIYSLPFLGDARFIQYDKKIFEEWGIEPLSDHPTLDEVSEKAKAMTGVNPVTGNDNYGIYFTGTNDTSLVLTNIVEGLNSSWGEGYKWDEIELEFDSPEMLEALDWLIDMSSYVPSGIMNGQGNELWNTPQNNIAISINTGPGALKTLFAQGIEDQYGIVQNFKNEEGIGGTFSGSPLAIANQSSNKELAWEFIKFTSSPFVQSFLWEEWGNTPVIAEATEWESITKHELMLPVLEAMSTAEAPRYPWASSQPRYILQSKVEGALTKSLTPEQALKEAQQESTEWLRAR